MQNLVNRTVLRNRYTLLLTVLVSYILLIVIEGEITNREPQAYTFENPYFDIDVNAPDEGLEIDQATEQNEISIRRLFWGR
ncbi:MAG: hypothetical protein WD772_05250 [Pseudohongiellaceae bacterium]